MNSRFKPDDVKIKFHLNNLFFKKINRQDLNNISEEELENWIKNKIQESNFSTKWIDAHRKYLINILKIKIMMKS